MRAHVYRDTINRVEIEFKIVANLEDKRIDERLRHRHSAALY